MKHQRTSCVTLCVIILAWLAGASPTFSAELRILGTIKAVDTPKAHLTIATEVDGKSQDETFTIRKQTKLTVGGKKANLKSLTAGQRVTITCDSQGNNATQIDACQPVTGEPTLEVLDELPDPQYPLVTPILASDGLTLYWNQFERPQDTVVSPWINVATRKSPADKFENAQQVVRGWNPTFTADGLRMIMFHAGRDRALYECVRKTTKAPFEAPQKIEELTIYDFLHVPSISADGLTLYASRSASVPQPMTTNFVMFQRKSRDAKWSIGPEVKFPGVDLSRLHGTTITADRMYALSSYSVDDKVHYPVVLRATRDGQGFESPKLIKLGDTVLTKFVPRSYHPATNELFGHAGKAQSKRPQIAVLKNFDPTALTEPPVQPMKKD